MHPIAYNDFADSPALLLSPRHHPFCTVSSSHAHSYPYHKYVPIMPPSPFESAMGQNPTPPLSNQTNTSKKRRREQPSIQTSFDDNSDVDMTLPPSKTPAISPEPVSGEEMPIIDPLTGQRTIPGGQSGSWFTSTLEERLGTADTETVDQNDGAGSQRVKRTCVRERASSSLADSTTFAAPTEPQDQAFETPQVDEFTQVLGVGWVGLGIDPTVLAAARGYCKYIENHYPLTNTEILAKSKSLDSYLVGTRKGYYLFNEELSKAQLIARDFETTLTRLKNGGVPLDDEHTLYAAKQSDVSPPNDGAMEVFDMEMPDAAENTHGN